MRRPSTALILLLVVFAACGDDDSTTTTTTTTTATTTTAAQASPGAVITIEGFDFGAPIEVAAGDAVTIVNSDATSHTWTAQDGSFDSGTISGGGEFEFTFDAPGDYRFFCSIHPQMTGSITVTG